MQKISHSENPTIPDALPVLSIVDEADKPGRGVPRRGVGDKEMPSPADRPILMLFNRLATAVEGISFLLPRSGVNKKMENLVRELFYPGNGWGRSCLI